MSPRHYIMLLASLGMSAGALMYRSTALSYADNMRDTLAHIRELEYGPSVPSPQPKAAAGYPTYPNMRY